MKNNKVKCKFCEIEIEGEYAYRGFIDHLKIAHLIDLMDISGFVKK